MNDTSAASDPAAIFPTSFHLLCCVVYLAAMTKAHSKADKNIPVPIVIAHLVRPRAFYAHSVFRENFVFALIDERLGEYREKKREIMHRLAPTILFAVATFSTAAWADATTPPHTIAVAGEAELLMPPDHATIELGVVTQAPDVSSALADNSARMSRVIVAMKSLGIPAKNIQTSRFVIQPKYAPTQDRNYAEEEFRTIIGYYISNKVTVTVKDLTNIAKIIDDSVSAGANASGNVVFGVDNLSSHLDEARRKAIESAHHKAEVLTSAAHIGLGTTLSITDNQADTSYNNGANGTIGGDVETVVVTGSIIPTPIEPGLVRIDSKVTVVYATR